MIRIAATILLAFFALPVWAQTAVPDVTKINHAWVDGVYWNPSQLPGWGFFVDVQEDLLFGAVYGYEGSDSTFITLQGRISREDPLEFRGDVFFVSNGGSTVTDVGNFTWKVGQNEASPSALITINSNILNKSNMLLQRFVTAETDKVDMLTAADWNITTEAIIHFAHFYGISDDRITDDGITYARVVNNFDTDRLGIIGYFPPGRGESYALFIEFGDDTDLFAVFLASDTEMFGRYWLLDEGDDPTGNGFYYHGAANTMQAPNQLMTENGSITLQSVNKPILEANGLADQKSLQQSLYEVSSMENEPMFSESAVQYAFKKLSELNRSRID